MNSIVKEWPILSMWGLRIMLVLNVYSSFQDYENFLNSSVVDSLLRAPNRIESILRNGVTADLFGNFSLFGTFNLSSANFTLPTGFRFAELRNANLTIFPDGTVSDVFDSISVFLSGADDILDFANSDNIETLFFEVSDNLYIDFGDGFDTIIFYLDRSSVYVDLDSQGSVFFRANDSPLEKYDSIERIILKDGKLVFDLADDSLPYVYRLYDAAFARTPDEGGLRFWVNEVGTGAVAREDLAEAFVVSDEFALLFGADPTDAEFVNALYGNVLRREADPEGLGFWTGVFASGEKTRADMLEFFAESPENVERNADNLDDGVWVV